MTCSHKDMSMISQMPQMQPPVGLAASQSACVVLLNTGDTPEMVLGLDYPNVCDCFVRAPLMLLIKQFNVYTLVSPAGHVTDNNWVKAPEAMPVEVAEARDKPITVRAHL